MKNTNKKAARTVTFSQFSALAEGLTDVSIGDLLGVSRQTAHRWRTSGTVPYAAFALLELWRGTLPAIYGEFRGWRVTCAGRLVGPGDHEQISISAGQARAAFYAAGQIEAQQLQIDTLRATLANQAALIEQLQTERDFFRRLVKEANAFSFIPMLKGQQ